MEEGKGERDAQPPHPSRRSPEESMPWGPHIGTWMASVLISLSHSLLSFVPSECTQPKPTSNSYPKGCFYRNPSQDAGLVHKLLRGDGEGYILTNESMST